MTDGQVFYLGAVFGLALAVALEQLWVQWRRTSRPRKKQ